MMSRKGVLRQYRNDLGLPILTTLLRKRLMLNERLKKSLH